MVGFCIGSSCPQTFRKNERQRALVEYKPAQGPSTDHWDQNLQDVACESAYLASAQVSLVTERHWVTLMNAEAGLAP